MEWMLVALGGGIGATLRYAVIKFSNKLQICVIYATAIVNLVGSFLLGVVLQIQFAEILLSFLVIGILGAFTTFSTFAFDLVNLFTEKQFRVIFLYVAVNLVGGLLLFVLGYYI